MKNYNHNMKNKGLLIIPALVAAISAPSFLSAKENVGMTGGKTPPPTINAACVEATAQSDLAVNNVRTRILMGDMWWDLSHGIYEIPKGGGLHSIFAGSLWMGGIDVGGQLKVAAQTYRQTGNDFWPGPLDTTNASVDMDVCSEYDKHFRITRKEVEAFVGGVSGPTPAILNWPGNGDISKGQAQFLAPFFDKNGDGIYSPSAGDYPGYDLVQGDGYGECQQVNCIPVDQLFGDETLWWVFNDKGNVHTETGGQEIGVEIRAQAFGFFTDDEINNMTFYNYRIYNRSSFQVDSFYFGVWCDADLGEYTDDYVGCDVKRGLGYTYNGDNFDDPPAGYGNNPPAVGIDFFRGPIANANDGKDNDRNCLTDEPCEQIIMSGFLYYDNESSPKGNPVGATHFYNYLRMRWGNGLPVVYNGTNGYSPQIGPPCNFMFPGNPSSDEHDWGIGGNCSTIPTLPGWDEVTAGTVPADRRMLQSAGPFTLMPGAVNVITTGVVWARATSGGAQASVKLLRITDDKAQALFDNCFKVLDGPDAPDVTIQELDKELILYLTNTNPTSNNYNETYQEFDPLISLVDSNGNTCPNLDATYDFEGYKIYQLKNATISAAELDDPDKARLVAQCDIKNNVSRLVNYEFDQNLGAVVPVEKVSGNNTGIVHSIRITEDKFATGANRLINHKTYYYMVIAYGYNEFKKYQQDLPPTNSNMCDPNVGAYTGQKKPYKQGRKNIFVYSAIPHNPMPETGGTEIHGSYGAGPRITRIEGNGNGGMNLEMTTASIHAILSANDHRIKEPTYEYGRGPINVKVVDPLNVPEGHSFELRFDSANIANSTWKLKNLTTGETINSDKTIALVNEQLILKWGISIAIEQIADPGSAGSIDNGFISASMTFAEPSQTWLTGVADRDGPYYENWIRSGTITGSDPFQNDYSGVDVDQIYEGILGGTWAPYRLCAATDPSMTAGYDPAKFFGGPGFKLNVMNQAQMKDLASVDLVITSDKSKWTRCVVLEMCEDPLMSANTIGFPTNARKLDFRRAPSVDKNGRKAGDPGYNSAEGDLISSIGMGWFPGYAINLETGERLNIAFGENSALGSGVFDQNGDDMLWNPTTQKTDFVPWDLGKKGPVFGGQHYIYVFGNNKINDPGTPTPNDTINVPRYDYGKRIREILGWTNGQPTDAQKRELYRDAMWVSIPLLAPGHSLLSTDVTIKLRVGKSYKKGYSAAFWQDGLNIIYGDTSSSPQNNDLPMYRFSTEGIATHTGVSEVAKEALDMIRVVPNPYYAFSSYETGQLDNRVKITNLPEKCTVSIYNLGGTLVRRYVKGQPYTNHTPKGLKDEDAWHDGSIDWDLKNSKGIPIASGVYVIHVEVPDVGEKVVKWFGITRPPDLSDF